MEKIRLCIDVTDLLQNCESRNDFYKLGSVCSSNGNGLLACERLCRIVSARDGRPHKAPNFAFYVRFAKMLEYICMRASLCEITIQ